MNDNQAALLILGLFFGGIFIVLPLWGKMRMKEALKKLEEVGRQAQNLLKEEGEEMACKCQEKKHKDPTFPCPEPEEETFRTAFLAESKKTTRLSAQNQALEIQNSEYRRAAQETISNLQKRNQELEEYARKAFETIPKEQRIEFLKDYGSPPISLRIKNGSK